MTDRPDFRAASPEAYQAVLALDRFVQKDSGIARRLLHLVKIRASILNRCAFCLDMHVRHARDDGLPEQWITLLAAWEDALVYSDAERALLGWVDALTLIADSGAPDAAFDAMRAHFDERQVANLTVAIGTINVWNRVMVGFRRAHPIDEAVSRPEA